MTQSGSGKKVANSLVSASCAAVLAVYVAGYERTQSAADRFAAQVAERRVPVPQPPRTALLMEETAPSALPPPAISSKPVGDAGGKRAPITSAEPVRTPANVAGSATAASSVDIPAPLPAVAAIALPAAGPVVKQAPEPVPPAEEHKMEVTPAAPPAPMPPKPVWKDGTYTGWGYSRHGDIEAAVVIEGGRIASATISQCRTRYSCSVIDRLPPEVAQRQSPDVDYVSGATQSADAFYGAVVEALGKAK